MDNVLTLPFILSVITAATTGIFAFVVLRRWYDKHRPHLLAWGIGLALYFLGTLSQVVLSLTWSPLFFGLWYWSGALMVAPWLGQGTAYLLIRRGSIARNIQMALVLVAIMTLPWTLFFTEMNPDAWYRGADMTEIYKQIMGEEIRGTVRFFSPVMNTWGTILLVGGAIYSARLFRRKQIMRNRMVGNWYIALGGLLPALGGVFIRLGDPSYKYLGEMLGAVLIFIGFWLATNVPEDERQPRAHHDTSQPEPGGTKARASLKTSSERVPSETGANTMVRP